jgi:hypothetical protein
MPNPNVGSLVATTLRNRRKNVADTVTNHNALLMLMNEQGSIKEVAQGGRTIFEPLFYGTNSSVSFYSGYETFTPPTGLEVIDGAEYNWKQLGGFVSISGLEMVQNSGKYAAVDLLETRIKHLQAQLSNTFATSIYSNGTGTGGKEFGGLGLLVADNPAAAGVAGGVDQAANPFWRNQVSAAAVFNTVTAKARMNAMYLNTIRGKDKTNLWLADNEMYTQYWAGEQELQRYTDSKLADKGFANLKFNGAPLVYDDNCPARRMYALNTDALSFRYAPSRWFEVGDARQVTNADYEVVPVWTMGNMTTNNRALQGVIISSGIV